MIMLLLILLYCLDDFRLLDTLRSRFSVVRTMAEVNGLSSRSTGYLLPNVITRRKLDVNQTEAGHVITMAARASALHAHYITLCLGTRHADTTTIFVRQSYSTIRPLRTNPPTMGPLPRSLLRLRSASALQSNRAASQDANTQYDIIVP